MAVKILRNYYVPEEHYYNLAVRREICDTRFLIDHNLTEDDVDMLDLGYDEHLDEYTTEFRILTFWQKLLRRICGK